MLNLKNLEITDLTHLTKSGFVLFSPVSLLAYSTSTLVANPNSSIILLNVAGLLITLAIFALYSNMIWLQRILKLNQKSGLLIFFLFTMGLIGFVRGILFYYANEILNMKQPSDLLARISSSTLTTFLWLSSAIVVLNISRQFKREYQSTLNQYLASQISLAARNINSQNEIEELQEFHKELSKSIVEVQNSSSNDAFTRLSERLTFHLNEQLRPLSRRIWLRSLSEYPVINFKIVLLDSLKTLNFSEALFFIIISSLAILNNLFLRSIAETFWRTFSFLIATFLVMRIFRLIRIQTNSLYLNLVFLLAVSVIPIYLSEVSIGFLGYTNSYLAALFIIPVPIAVIVVLALIDLTQKDRGFLLNLLKDKRDSIYEQSALGIDPEKRQIASYLHNSFQSELLALSSQMASAAISNDKSQTSAILQRVNAFISRSINDDFQRLNEKPLERLNTVIDSWKNILEIQVDIPDELLTDSAKLVLIVQTIEEVASNSYRHGKATHLKVKAEKGEIGIRLICQSNGKNPLIRSKGVGISWLDQVSLTPWSIKRNSEGVLLTLEV